MLSSLWYYKANTTRGPQTPVVIYIWINAIAAAFNFQALPPFYIYTVICRILRLIVLNLGISSIIHKFDIWTDGEWWIV